MSIALTIRAMDVTEFTPCDLFWHEFTPGTEHLINEFIPGSCTSRQRVYSALPALGLKDNRI